MMSKSPKRMIMTVGDARVGKSTVSKLLIDVFQCQGKKIKVYDHDNHGNLKAYESLVPLQSLDFFANDTDQVLNDFNNEQLDIIMIDMPGQYLEKICQYIQKSNLFELLADYQWKLTFLQPISHRIDCLGYMNQLINYASNNANYVVVKNHHFDTRFTEYQQSMQGKLSVIGGAEIELLALHRDHYQVLERACKPYSLCYGDISINVVYRTYIYHWINNFRNSLMTNSASKYLGF